MNQYNTHPPIWASSGGRSNYANNNMNNIPCVPFNFGQRYVRFEGTNRMPFPSNHSQHKQQYHHNTPVVPIRHPAPSTNNFRHHRPQNNKNRNFSPNINVRSFRPHAGEPIIFSKGPNTPLYTPQNDDTNRIFSNNGRSARSPPRISTTLSQCPSLPKGPRTPPHTPQDDTNRNFSSNGRSTPRIPPPKGPRTPPYTPPPDTKCVTPPPPVSSSSKKILTKQCNEEKKLTKNSHKQNNAKQKKISENRNSCVTKAKKKSPAKQFKSASKPSPLNTAVQQYLLQVLTSKPQPVDSTVTTINSTSYLLSSTGILGQPPPPLQTPPPLPPTPEAAQPPPPPPPLPSDESTGVANGNLDQNDFTKSYIEADNSSKITMDTSKVSGPKVKTKKQRKKFSLSKATMKEWNMEEAQMALKAEQELSKDYTKETVLNLRFPDPPLNREIVQSYCKEIESVHFHSNFAPRYCLVYLKEGVDANRVVEKISKIPFGNGFISAEIRKMAKPNGHDDAKNVDTIDPYTLYVGNLAPTVVCKVLKEHFPGAARIDIGYSQRLKCTRYAFIRYHKAEDAIAAYRRMVNTELEGRTLILRFRRYDSISKEDSLDNALQEDETMADGYSMISTSSLPSELSDAVNTSTQDEAIENVVDSTTASDVISNMPTIQINEDVTTTSPENGTNSVGTEKNISMEEETNEEQTNSKVVDNGFDQDEVENSTTMDILQSAEDQEETNLNSCNTHMEQNVLLNDSVIGNKETNSTKTNETDLNYCLRTAADVVGENQTETPVISETDSNSWTNPSQTLDISDLYANLIEDKEKSVAEKINDEHVDEPKSIETRKPIEKDTHFDTRQKSAMAISDSNSDDKGQNDAESIEKTQTVDFDCSERPNLQSNHNVIGAINDAEYSNASQINDNIFNELKSSEINQSIESGNKTDSNLCTDISTASAASPSLEHNASQSLDNDEEEENIVDHDADKEINEENETNDETRPNENQTDSESMASPIPNQVNISNTDVDVLSSVPNKEVSSHSNNTNNYPSDLEMEKHRECSESETPSCSGTSTSEESTTDTETRSDSTTSHTICEENNSVKLQNSKEDKTESTIVPSIIMDTIKSEPGAEDDDIVGVNNLQATNPELFNIPIKVETNRFDEDYEFYSVCGSSHKEESLTSKVHSSAADNASVTSETSDSSCDLSEFLRLCESSHESMDETSPPKKKLKTADKSKRRTKTPVKNVANVVDDIKEEVNEEGLGNALSIPTTISTTNSTSEDSAIKQESMEDDAIDNDILIIDTDDILLAPLLDIKSEDAHPAQPVNQGSETVNTESCKNTNAKEDDLASPTTTFTVPLTTPRLLRSNKQLNSSRTKEEGQTNYPKENQINSNKIPKKLVRTSDKEKTSLPISRSKSCKGNSPSKSTTMEKPIAKIKDEDLVPANNALNSLGFYDLTLDDEPPAEVKIKIERETEDLFLLPKTVIKSDRNDTRDIPKGSSIKKTVVINVERNETKEMPKDRKRTKKPDRGLQKCSEVSRNKNTNEIIDCTDASDDDDDVIIVGCDNERTTLNSFPKPKTVGDKIKLETPSHTDLSTKQNSPQCTQHKKSSFFGSSKTSNHGDNLDRLFKLLDSNSDSDEEL
ncbi:RNA binding domain-containing protein painting of fourth [Musca autumnalis]|uniref:RNA binding domain-containing protein painting of fourth n=1 Tax=Musca autumnalis TaxID=221902 RepID=UPI003CF33FD7